MTGDEIAARARSLVGVRFRAQGRSPATGLDCVGLVAGALGVERARSDYALRGGNLGRLSQELEAAGLVRVDGCRAGDVLVMRAGPEQLHLGIVTEAGLVHADAGLRRVVERPGAPEWPVLGSWRVPGDFEGLC
ncbi:MAG TPA: peptidoglycan endopeptidase [Allosphingosinicella sp.]|jgi:cell wall-associated NlpC family hydrolase|uniref:peptidoglycan endopeptidase n=1 Tax=Allosphingosinicella sp. TaxID=2823234 RepID=UPI002F2A8191